jgi:hypothetical protein
MKFLLVVYILINGDWIRGDDLESDGWSAMPYATEEQCLRSKARAEQIQADLKLSNPRAFDKRFVCESSEAGAAG